VGPSRFFPKSLRAVRLRAGFLPFWPFWPFWRFWRFWSCSSAASAMLCAFTPKNWRNAARVSLRLKPSVPRVR
jgi:hypothetical protein